MRELWGAEGVDRPIVVIDSQPLYQQLRSGRAAAEPRLTATIKYMRQELEVMNAELRWTARSHQQADAMTRVSKISVR